MDTEHVHVDAQTPQAQRAAIGLATTVTTAAAEAGLDRATVELINVRVSQLNGCPTCLETHHRKAVAAGVTAKQLATLAVWRDTELFDDRQRAVLRLAEITTTLPDHDVAEREYARARSTLTDDEIAAAVWVAVAINAFNRVSILSRHRVRP